MSDPIAATLEERGNRYGPFKGHAEVTQRIKEAMASTGLWTLLNESQREALEMIAHKIGRIINGDPYYADSWHDIAGYARLVEDQIIAADGANKRRLQDYAQGLVRKSTPPTPEI